jgi:glycerophosphoryl diester phosphodiesterase
MIKEEMNNGNRKFDSAWNIILLTAACAFLLTVYSCEKKYDAPVPDTTWELFESADAIAMNNSSRNAMEGVYHTTEGIAEFGQDAALKWSYVINQSDTTFHLSVFMPEDITYMICEGKRIDSLFIFNGYWRKMLTSETGIARFTIDPLKGGRNIMKHFPAVGRDSIELEGVYGFGEQFPSNRLVLRYERSLNNDTNFLIMAHRCGGRSADVLPASENSIEMLMLASELGATGIEMDVRLTRDGVPIIYHDENLNDRLTQENGMTGKIGDYNYAQIHDLVRLVNGEQIPTLTDALNTIIYKTSLKFVWLDIKLKTSLELIRSIQKEYLLKAAAAGRNVQIVIGISDEAVFDNFNSLTDHLSAPSLCELDIEKVRQVNSMVWASRWTAGLVDSEVSSMHAEGRKVFAWTIDEPQYIEQFVTQGHFDALLTNYPSALAYYHYVQ